MDLKIDDQRGKLPIVQICWVVADLDRAMQHWLGLGVGPFFTATMDRPEARYKGEPAPLRFKAGLAQSGGVQIELIEQTSDGASAYRDAIPKGQSGFHHICREYGAFDETVAAARSQGCEVVMESMLFGGRVCYVDTRPLIGCMLEVVDRTALSERLFSTIAAAARNWDGSDPIRPLDIAALAAPAAT